MTDFKKLKIGAFACLLTFAFTSSVYAEIIFETDFAEDGDFYARYQQATWTEIGENKPKGFDGAKAKGSGGYIKGMPGEGVDGSVALKFMWDPALGQPTTQLYKHLTGDENTGYDEVYIRYKIRLPDNFKAGRPELNSIPYWKFGRLWQNTGVATGAKWTENRVDSFYAVWNFGGSDKWGVDAGGTFSANSGGDLTKGSSGGPRYSNDYYIGAGSYETKPGHFRHFGNGAWDFHSDTRMLKNRNQSWHTIEWRFKLSSNPTSGDGVFQMWFDGVEQVPDRISQGKAGAPVYDPQLGANANPTAKHGSGYNMLIMFDNMAEWNKDWDEAGIEGGIYVNDLVISTQRIGHDYYVGGPPLNSPPKAPSLISSQ